VEDKAENCWWQPRDDRCGDICLAPVVIVAKPFFSVDDEEAEARAWGQGILKREVLLYH